MPPKEVWRTKLIFPNMLALHIVQITLAGHTFRIDGGVEVHRHQTTYRTELVPTYLLVHCASERFVNTACYGFWVYYSIYNRMDFFMRISVSDQGINPKGLVVNVEDRGLPLCKVLGWSNHWTRKETFTIALWLKQKKQKKCIKWKTKWKAKKLQKQQKNSI